MPKAANLDAYCARIGYTGPRAPTLETLAGIHFRHPQAIAFEDLDTLLKRPFGLDIEALERKMIYEGRGGWCFEQNLLLSDVLQTLGFRVTRLAARVMWNAPDGEARARSHMLLKIDALEGGPHIADVGFGGLTLTGPLRLVTGVAQPTPHETFRLTGGEGNFVLEARLHETWRPVYSFDLQPQLQVDYEVSHWFLANHPQSPFANRLMVARATADRRYALLNNKLSIHHLGGDSEQLTCASAGELRHTLEDTFGIRLPEDPGLEGLLARVAA
jgi:N-hydroxyarylamine O-acetyltransferase